MKLSKRLEHIARLVSKGNRLADIGTDHGWLPISLVLENKVPFALAMDLRKGPLLRANQHIQEYALESKINTRISDGIQNLEMGEIDTIVIAGMGGELMVRILKDGERMRTGIKEYILSPHSDWALVRKYLREEQYQIIKEDMVYEDGKYYIIIKALPYSQVFSENIKDKKYTVINQEEFQKEIYQKSDIFGERLILEKHPIFIQYLKKEQKKYRKIYGELKDRPFRIDLEKRKEEIQVYLEYIKEILDEMQSVT